jgi:superfamily II DNA/RNA helicase
MTSFSDLNLNPKVMKAVAEAGYETPTPIQAGAIPPALEGRDVLGIAQTGTGKTASFTLPMITRWPVAAPARACRVRLVLCPTRELAAQVAENFDTYAKYVKLTKALLIGGVSFKEQDQLIDKGVDVLIATPGRLLDHFERGKLILTDVKVMVVDEADRMLDMGFIPISSASSALCRSPARRCSSPPPWRPRSSGSPTPSCRTPNGSRWRARPRVGHDRAAADRVHADAP